MSSNLKREMPYAYPVTNSELIKIHKLIPHPEGGHFMQTAALNSLVPDQKEWKEELTSPVVQGEWSTLPSSISTRFDDQRRCIQSLTSSCFHQGKGREHRGWGPGTTFLGGSEEDDEPKGKDKILEATIIYYLLTGEQPRGAMHMNVHPVSHPGKQS